MDELNFDDDNNTGPHFEVEDIGCQCTDAGIDSEWMWDQYQGCYVCQGCGDVQ